jgi:hypothetical protein
MMGKAKIMAMIYEMHAEAREFFKKIGVFASFLVILLYIAIVAGIVYFMLFVTIHWWRW